MSTAYVLRALGLGDTVTGLPALHLVRAALPGHHIVLATPERWTPLVAGVVDEIVDSHELAALPPRASAPELAIDLHGSGAEGRDLLAALRPGRLLAYADGPVRWNPDEHDADRWVRLVRDGLPTDLPAPRRAGILGPPPSGGVPRGRTVLHCGAQFPSRQWPPDRFVALAVLLLGEGHDVVVTGGPGERELAAAIASRAGVAACTELSVVELMGLVGTARLVVSGDTGVAHLAAAYERPSVTMFGPVSPSRWGPPRHPRHAVLWHGDGTGDPHGATLDPALARITVGEVVAATHEVLAAAPT